MPLFLESLALKSLQLGHYGVPVTQFFLPPLKPVKLKRSRVPIDRADGLLNRGEGYIENGFGGRDECNGIVTQSWF